MRSAAALLLTAVVAASLSPLAAADGGSSPTALRADRVLSPALVATHHPRLVWRVPQLACCAQGAGCLQSAYSLEFYTANGTLHWASGAVSSGSNLGVDYNGAPLADGTLYRWRVKVTAKDAAAAQKTCDSDWSAMAELVPRPNATLWSSAGSPIWASSKTNSGPASYVFLRSPVTTMTKPVLAVAYVAAVTQGSERKLLGAYRLSVDGNLLAAGPGRADAPTGSNTARVHDAINVTAALAQGSTGSHVFALQGYYEGVGQAGIHLVVRLWDAHGAMTQFVSDASWHALDATAYFGPTGSTGGSYKQPAENQDARHWPGNWTTQGFTPDDTWAAAEAQPAFDPAPLPKRTVPVEIAQVVQPQTVRHFGPGRWFIDFGSEGMYGLRLVVTGNYAGQKVNVVGGEELTGNNTILNPMRTGNHYDWTWTLTNGTSFFELHEYIILRYVTLQFPDVPVKCQTIPEDASGTFGCGTSSSKISAVSFADYGTPTGSCNPDGTDDFKHDTKCTTADAAKTVEKLCLGHSSCKVTASNAAFGGDPCDKTVKHASICLACNGDGDAAAAAAAAEPMPVFSAWRARFPWDDSASAFTSSNDTLNQVYNLGRNTLRVTSLDTFTDSQTRERLPYEADGVITLMSRLALQDEYTLADHSVAHLLNNPTWPTEWRQIMTLGAHQVYMATNDTTAVAGQFQQLYNFSQALCINPKTNLVDFNQCTRLPGTRDLIDWPQASRDGYVLSNVSVVINAYTSGMLDILGDLAGVLGNAGAQTYKKQAAAIKASIQKNMYDKTLHTFTDGVGIDHSAWHSTAFPAWFNLHPDEDRQAALARMVNQGMTGSVYAALAYINGLYNYDDTGQAALDIMAGCAKNSWCNMLREGATATMEAWTTDEKPNLSWSHPWSTCFIDAIARHLMGIQPTAAGYATFDVKPKLGNLASASITRPTLGGPITLSSKASRHVTLVHPANSVARICLPRCDGGGVGEVLVNAVRQNALALDAEGCVVGLAGGRADGWQVERRCS